MKIDAQKYRTMRLQGSTLQEIVQGLRQERALLFTVISTVADAFGKSEAWARRQVLESYREALGTCSTPEEAFDRLTAQEFHPLDAMDIVRYVFRLSDSCAKAVLIRQTTGKSPSEHQGDLTQALDLALRSESESEGTAGEPVV